MEWGLFLQHWSLHRQLVQVLHPLTNLCNRHSTGNNISMCSDTRSNNKVRYLFKLLTLHLTHYYQPFSQIVFLPITCILLLTHIHNATFTAKHQMNQTKKQQSSVVQLSYMTFVQAVSTSQFCCRHRAAEDTLQVADELHCVSKKFPHLNSL